MAVISEEPKLARMYKESPLPEPFDGRPCSKVETGGRKVRSMIHRVSPLA